MQWEASYEKRSSRSRASSRSPLRSSLKRSASFSNYAPSLVPLGGYVAPAPAPAPAPATWVHGATKITYPTHVFPTANTYSNTAVATYNPTYTVPGAYPSAPGGPSGSSYVYKTTEANFTYPSTSTTTAPTYPTYKPPSPRPLENPEVKAAIAHEQNLRMLSEQSHQETLKRQILEIELQKAAAQREKVRMEEDSRQRMHRLYLLSQQQQQQQLVMDQAARAVEEAHHRYHHHHVRSRSAHRARSIPRSRSRSRGDIEFDEHRRANHTCSKCNHRGHYSRECHTYHHRSSSMLMIENGPRSSAPALLGPPSRGRRSRRGSVCSRDSEEYAVFESEEEDEAWLSDGYGEREVARVVPADSGVLVMYAPGGGPATRRSSIRHVVG